MRLALACIVLATAACDAAVPAVPGAQHTRARRGGGLLELEAGEIRFEGVYIEDQTRLSQPGVWHTTKAFDVEVASFQSRVANRAAFRCRFLPEPFCRTAVIDAKIESTRVAVLASADTPHIVVKKMMFLLNRRGIQRLGFVVQDERGRLRDLGLKWTPCEEWEPVHGSCSPRCTRFGVP